MSLEIRCGSSLAEDTLFPQAPPVYPKKDSHRFGLRAQLEDLQFMKKHTSKNKMNDYSIHKSNSRNQIDETTEAEDNEIDMQKKFESVASATSKLPSSDHALVYTVLYSGVSSFSYPIQFTVLI